MINLLKKYWNILLQENQRSFYLAFLRVAMSLWLLVELYSNWPYFAMLFGTEKFIADNNTTGAIIGLSFSFIGNHYLLLSFVFVILCIMNLAGIGKWVTALLLFLMVDLFQKTDIAIVNGGNKMARLVLFYLIFANSYEYFVLVKSKSVHNDKRKFLNLLSNLSAYSIMFQLCVAYFVSGIAKLQVELWRNGEATYYALMIERFMGTSFNQHIAQSRLFVIVTNYFTLLFELLFPFLIWVKKMRKPFIIMGILLHIGIYIFLMIYGFQVIFILIYGLFFTNEELLTFAGKYKRSFFRNKKTVLS